MERRMRMIIFLCDEQIFLDSGRKLCILGNSRWYTCGWH
jgi:hypothetical protein